jgi:two-component system, chemotaxis family, chemotaxis protein CheY
MLASVYIRNAKLVIGMILAAIEIRRHIGVKRNESKQIKKSRDSGLSRIEEGTMRALIVDDSRAIRGIIGKMLRQIGFEIVEAGHGIEAIQRLKESGSVDVMLVDWNMPEMNGYDFLCKVRADPAYCGIPLMMVTSETEMSQMSRALEAGANEYVMKPFTKEMITDKLALLGVVP